MKAELFAQVGCVNAEGPVWDEETGTLWFIDVEAGAIFSAHENNVKRLPVGEKIGTMALCRNSGRLIMAVQSGIYLMDPVTGKREKLGDPEEDLPQNRFNDGKADPAGRFLAGTLSMDQDENPGARAALYSVSKDGPVRKLISDVVLANGLTWSADGKTFYFIDTGRAAVTHFDYDLATGDISNGRVVITVPAEMGVPDGMTIDDEGMLWIALWGGCAVSRWNPATGELLEKIDVPALNVSSCCFGGPDMSDLFITTASQDTDMSAYPLAGNVFIAHPGVRGSRMYKYED